MEDVEKLELHRSRGTGTRSLYMLLLMRNLPVERVARLILLGRLFEQIPSSCKRPTPVSLCYPLPGMITVTHLLNRQTDDVRTPQEVGANFTTMDFRLARSLLF